MPSKLKVEVPSEGGLGVATTLNEGEGTYGLLVSQVAPGKLADQAGVKSGMFIARLAGRNVEQVSGADVKKKLRKLRKKKQAFQVVFVDPNYVGGSGRGASRSGDGASSKKSSKPSRESARASSSKGAEEEEDNRPCTLSHWTISRTANADDGYAELVAPDSTIVDWPGRCLPPGLAVGSRLRIDVRCIGAPEIADVQEVTFGPGKLGLGLDQNRDSLVGVMVSSLRPGGAADKSGAVSVGDLVLAVNGKPCENLSFLAVMELIKEAGRPLILRLKPRPWLREMLLATTEHVVQHVVSKIFTTGEDQVEVAKNKLKSKLLSRVQKKQAHAPTPPSGPAPAAPKANLRSSWLRFGHRSMGELVESAVIVDRFLNHVDSHGKTSRVLGVKLHKRSLASRKKLERRLMRRSGKEVDDDGEAEESHAEL